MWSRSRVTVTVALDAGINDDSVKSQRLGVRILSAEQRLADRSNYTTVETTRADHASRVHLAT